MLNPTKPYVIGSPVRRKIGGDRRSDIIKQNSIVPEPIDRNQFQIQKESREFYFQSPVLVWINTYNRPNELKSLLSDIYENRANFKIKVFIFDDGSQVDYSSALHRFAGKLEIVYHRMTTNHGKRLYWKLCNYALSVIKEEAPYHRYFVKIDDDCRLVKDFFLKCANIWESINDKKKICLNFRLDTREGRAVWTGFIPRTHRFDHISVYLSQWVDMDFFCEASMLEALNYQIREQFLRRWTFNKAASSGVGRDISIRLTKAGYRLYLTTETLVNHDHHDSKMNPEERGRNPLVTKPIINLKYGLPL